MHLQKDYNRRFAKEPLHDFNAHRPLALDDDLDAEFTWREPRRVSKNLTVQYDKMLYLIEDNEYCHERCNSDPHPTPEIRSRG